MTQPSVTRLLTRHFFRRFFDNDLISPHVDLHENIVVLWAAIVSTMLFASVFLATKALFGIPIPGPTAVLSLGDNFFFMGSSMIVMALLAAIQWDALNLDARDTINLGTLPIARGDIVRAKLGALLMFAASFAAALNLAPSIVYQSFLVAKIPVGLGGLLTLVIVHAVVATVASAFGFLTVLGVREVLRAIAGDRWFARISPIVQTLLVVLLVSALLMLPAIAATVPRRWVATGFPAAYAMPPLWFVSLSETVGGGVVAKVAGLRIPRGMVAQNERGLALYRSNEPLFRELAGVAMMAVVLVLVVAVTAYAWNARRLPQPPVSSSRQHRGLPALTRIFAGRHPVTRAGFAFAIQAILRNAPHRLSMSAAGAVMVAVSLGMLSRVDLRTAIDPAAVPLSVLALQTVILTILLAAFRHAVRVPAEPRANWIIQMAWRGNERRYIAGVKRAALVTLAGPPLLLLFPAYAWYLGDRMAAAHFAVGLVSALTLVEALFAGFRNVPFASSYVGGGNLKTLGPIAVLLFFVSAYAFAALERLALQSTRGLTILLVCIGASFVSLRLLDLWLRRGRTPVTLDEPPELTTQWLGLTD